MRYTRIFQNWLQPETILFLTVLILMWLPLVSYQPKGQLPVYITAAEIVYGNAPGWAANLLQVRIWLILIALWALLGLVVFAGNFYRKKEFGFLLSLAGIITLLILQVNMVQNIVLNFGWAYWLSLLCFVLLAGRCYLRRAAGERNTEPAEKLHINIFTHTDNESLRQPPQQAKNK